MTRFRAWLWNERVILVDSNVPMYLVGTDHPHKVDARRTLETAITERGRLVTDVEVLQEILHRYVAMGCRDAIQPAVDALLGVGIRTVLSFDRGFESVAGITRIPRI